MNTSNSDNKYEQLMERVIKQLDFITRVVLDTRDMVRQSARIRVE